MAPHSIVIGALDENQCRRLAELTASTSYPGVIGPGLPRNGLPDRASELGLIPGTREAANSRTQRNAPLPGSRGYARTVTDQDAPLFAEWMMAFHQEAVLHDPVQRAGNLSACRAQVVFCFGLTANLAGVDSWNRASAAELRRHHGRLYAAASRGRGYAGSVTAATVGAFTRPERKIACLYRPSNNPISNRCYATIGFTPVCKSLHIHRRVEIRQALRTSHRLLYQNSMSQHGDDR